MSILKTISGTGQLAEMYSIDFNDDIALIGHSGSGDADISDKKPTMKIVKVFHGKTGGGYLTQFYPYTGPVTYLAITQDGDGHFKFVAAEGVNEEGKILSFGDTNMRTPLHLRRQRVCDPLERMRPTHHFAAATGRHIDHHSESGQDFQRAGGSCHPVILKREILPSSGGKGRRRSLYMGSAACFFYLNRNKNVV